MTLRSQSDRFVANLSLVSNSKAEIGSGTLQQTGTVLKKNWTIFRFQIGGLENIFLVLGWIFLYYWLTPYVLYLALQVKTDSFMAVSLSAL